LTHAKAAKSRYSILITRRAQEGSGGWRRSFGVTGATYLFGEGTNLRRRVIEPRGPDIPFYDPDFDVELAITLRRLLLVPLQCPGRQPAHPCPNDRSHGEPYRPGHDRAEATPTHRRHGSDGSLVASPSAGVSFRLRE
jgi:hypothetical protein